MIPIDPLSKQGFTVYLGGGEYYLYPPPGLIASAYVLGIGADRNPGH
jgi:hypothetical protein